MNDKVMENSLTNGKKIKENRVTIEEDEKMRR